MINDDLWEGNKTDSRQWTRDNATHLVDDVYYTPVDSWIKINSASKNRYELIRRTCPYPGLASDEPVYTGDFYKEVVAHQILHCGRVNDSLYVGSCPRSSEHISTDLGERLGITAVINLQELIDMEEHCQDIIKSDTTQQSKGPTDLNTILAVRSAYEKANILLIWMPIRDYSSVGRELMSPQATVVLKALLDKGHRVYVHCNAGS